MQFKKQHKLPFYEKFYIFHPLYSLAKQQLHFQILLNILQYFKKEAHDLLKIVLIQDTMK